jgi:hypothetical protein
MNSIVIIFNPNPLLTNQESFLEGTLIKRKEKFLIFKEMQKGAVAKSYD